MQDQKAEMKDKGGAALSEPSESSQGAYVNRGYILCVVEDPAAMGQLTAELRRKYGKNFAIELSQHAPAALELAGQLAESGARIALAIADETLPGMSGIDLLKRIQEKHPDAKAIMLARNGDVPVGMDKAQAVGHCFPKSWATANGRLIPIVEELLRETAPPKSPARAQQFTTGDVFAGYAEHGNALFAEMLHFFGMDRTFVHADGCYVFDERGERYLDVLGGFGAVNLGHNHPRIRARLANLPTSPIIMQARLCQYQADLLSLLARITPGSLTRAYLCNSGTEAAEAAIKTAVAATGKPKIAYADGAYHGKTLGALAITANERYRAPFLELLPEHPNVPYGDPDALDRLVAARDDIAAFIVEPIQGEGGVNVPPPGYLRQVSEVCRRRNILLIVDEIQTGLGRTGRIFDSMDIEPDILLMGKSLGGGMVPVAAMTATDKVWLAAYGTPETCLLHSSTFGGNTLACAVAVEAINTLIDEHLTENAAEVGAYFLGKLRDLQKRHAMMQDVRGKGLLIGLQLRFPFHENMLSRRFMGQIVASRLFREYRIITSFTLNRPGVLRLEPPLTFTKADADVVVTALDDLFTRLPRPDHHITTLAKELDAPQVPKPYPLGHIIAGRSQAVDPATATCTFETDAIMRDPDRLRLAGTPVNRLAPDQRDKVHALYHNVDTAANQLVLQSCVDAAEAFFHTPIEKRHRILCAWRRRIGDNFVLLAQLGSREGFNYRSMLYVVDTMLRRPRARGGGAPRGGCGGGSGPRPCR